MDVEPDSTKPRVTVYPNHDQFVVVPADHLRERPYTLTAFHMSGTTIRLGPVDVPEGIELIDGLLSPNGWTPRFDPRTPIEITDMDAARAVLTVSPTEPIAGTELFAALRAKILTDPTDNDEHDQAATLLAHIEPHRPWATYTGDTECLLGECWTTEEHPKCDIRPATPLCSACTPVYEDGSEYTPAWLDACRIAWPCAPLRAVATYYEVPLDELVELVPGRG
jgi:hypothetical protein